MSNIYNDYDVCIRKIRALLCSTNNSVPHLVHARNTAQWVDTLIKHYNTQHEIQKNNDSADSNCSQAIGEESRIKVSVAAFANDLQYVGESFGLKISPKDMQSYISYRQECHKNSVLILEKILKDAEIDPDFIKSVSQLIQYHEGGIIDGKEDILCGILRDADALSYFDVLCTFDFQRCTGVKEDIIRRFEYEYRRMSKKARQYSMCFRYSNNKVLDNIVCELMEKHKKELQDNIDYFGVIGKKMVIAENA